MKVKVCKNYSFEEALYKSDLYRSRHLPPYMSMTTKADYSANFETMDITEEELLDYVKKGYAIKINC